MTEHQKTREINIEDVNNEWDKDSIVDETVLNEELCRTASLHSKYVRYFIHFNKKLIDYKSAYQRLGNIKRKYYRGECTKEDLDKYKWIQYQGIPIKGVSDMQSALEFDIEMIRLQEKISEYEMSVKTIERIMNVIGYRDGALKTLFDYNKFIGGG